MVLLQGHPEISNRLQAMSRMVLWMLQAEVQSEGVLHTLSCGGSDSG
jgi:hypothetical protein